MALDGGACLDERAQILGITPDGTISAGGTCRLLRASNGIWFAINLARSADRESIGAWMGRPLDGSLWSAVADHAQQVPAAMAVERAQLLGIPAAVAVAPAPALSPTVVNSGEKFNHHDNLLVLDLSALWAGPLCGRILGELGARVVKAEFPDRPDGARFGSPRFWEQLNGAKEQIVVNRGSSQLNELLDKSDVVITSARPRAIDSLGLDLVRRVSRQGLIWVSITGYGYYSERSNWVAFGDDAAVAGGLAVAAGGLDAPVFVGDAPADPLAGLNAAAAVVASLGRGSMIDVSMVGSVARALTPIENRYAAPSKYESIKV